MRSIGTYLLVAVLGFGTLGWAGPPAPRGPDLAAVSNFNQGWNTSVFETSKLLPVRDFRDGIYWSQVERVPGRMTFDRPATTYPRRIGLSGATMSLTVNWGNKPYDDGDTPHSPEAVAAFARFAATAAETFPSVHAIEVGNEFNGTNFVSGLVKEVSSMERADYYTALLKATYAAVKQARPEVTVLGGATHSIPAGYLWRILDKGGGAAMDALSLHPYTTPPEQLTKQIGVLRRHPAAADLPIQVTEFGEPDRTKAAGYLLRDYCQMALAGVTRAAWYPLNDRGDGLVPLVDRNGTVTPAGRAYELAERLLAGHPARDVAPDVFTYACLFDEDKLVLWGEPRTVTLGEGLTAYDAEGAPLDPAALTLSMDQPILLRAEGAPIKLGTNVDLGPQTIIADSFHQFGYPEGDQLQAEGDGFDRFLRRNGREITLRTFPGQDAPGTLWTPYRANAQQRPVRLTATSMVPGKRGDAATEVVHRFRADRDMVVSVEAAFQPSKKSRDGVTIAIRQGDAPLEETTAIGLYRFERPGLELARGETLEFAVGPGGDPEGDTTDYRITIRRSD